MNRRDLLRLILAAPIAAVVDVERLLWTPKPIITVPAMPYGLFNPQADLARQYQTGLMFHRDAFAFIMQDLDLPKILRPFKERVDVVYGIGTRVSG